MSPSPAVSYIRLSTTPVPGSTAHTGLICLGVSDAQMSSIEPVLQNLVCNRASPQVLHSRRGATDYCITVRFPDTTPGTYLQEQVIVDSTLACALLRAYHESGAIIVIIALTDEDTDVRPYRSYRFEVTDVVEEPALQ